MRITIMYVVASSVFNGTNAYNVIATQRQAPLHRACAYAQDDRRRPIGTVQSERQTTRGSSSRLDCESLLSRLAQILPVSLGHKVSATCRLLCSLLLIAFCTYSSQFFQWTSLPIPNSSSPAHLIRTSRYGAWTLVIVTSQYSHTRKV